MARTKNPTPGPKNPYAPMGVDVNEGSRHARCVEHVEIDGLREPVCILRGQDREAVLADVRELIGG